MDSMDTLLPFPKRKPLKASNDIIPLDSPLIPWHLGMVSSPKLDGNRLLCIAGSLHTASWKAPRNERLLSFLGGMIDLASDKQLFFDMELYDRDASHHATLSGKLNSYRDPLPGSVRAYVFDAGTMEVFDQQCEFCPFEARIPLYKYWVELISDLNIIALEQRSIANAEQAQQLFEQDIENGFEGSMLRATKIQYTPRGDMIGGYYKHGRATNNQGIIFKIKNWAKSIGTIVNVHPRMQLRPHIERGERDELGRLTRPPKNSANYEPTECLGSMSVTVEDKWGTIGDTFNIGFSKGFPIEKRRAMWGQQLIGRRVEFKHMKHGSKDSGHARMGQLVRFVENDDE